MNGPVLSTRGRAEGSISRPPNSTRQLQVRRGHDRGDGGEPQQWVPADGAFRERARVRMDGAERHGLAGQDSDGGAASITAIGRLRHGSPSFGLPTDPAFRNNTRSTSFVRLLKTLLSNCSVDRGSLCPTHNKPFDLFAKGDGKWGLAPRAGLEPATLRLTAGCSAIELPRIRWEQRIVPFPRRAIHIESVAGVTDCRHLMLRRAHVQESSRARTSRAWSPASGA